VKVQLWGAVAFCGLLWTMSVAPVAASGPLTAAISREANRLALAPTAVPHSSGQPSETSRPLELKWGELAPVIQGHHVELALSEGRTVSGEVIVVRDDALVLDVSRSSDVRAFPNGNGTVPRTAIAFITLSRSRGSSGRTLGTVVGVLAGVVVGGYLAGTSTDSAGAGIPLFLATASGITVAGYYGGKQLDKEVTRIRVIP
jgi:hypothetical protein